DPSGLEPDLTSGYDKYKAELCYKQKNHIRITSLMNAINQRKTFDKTWTQQEILDYYVMFITPGSSGLTEDQLKKGFSELQKIFAVANETNLGAVQDRCVEFTNTVLGKAAPLQVIRASVKKYNTPYGVFPKIKVGEGELGGFIDHCIMIFALPK